MTTTLTEVQLPRLLTRASLRVMACKIGRFAELLSNYRDAVGVESVTFWLYGPRTQGCKAWCHRPRDASLRDVRRGYRG